MTLDFIKFKPSKWVFVTLEEIAEWGSGGTPKSTIKDYYDGEIPWLIIGDLNDGYITTSEKQITELGLKNSSAKMVSPGSVLVAMYGSIGKLGINRIPVATNQAIAFTKHLYENVYNKYLFYFLLLSRPHLHKLGKGGTQKNISQTVLKKVTFPLSPLAEQHRIVAKIEELFSELNQGIESLKTAQQQLKIYRQAVLKWAFEGKLTAEWREQQQKEGKLESLVSKKLSSEIVENWTRNKLKKISTLITSGSRGWSKYYSESGSYFIRAQDIKTDKLITKNVARVNLPKNVEGKRAKVDKNDLLITITGANVTKSALVISDLKTEAYVNQHIALIKLKNTVNYQYVYWWIVSDNHGRSQLNKLAYGAGKPGLNLTNIRDLNIVLPPLLEQHQIVQEIESRFSICDQLEATIKDNLEKSEALRQSILKRAMTGKLVPQDPNDEPAEKLLERIKQEKAGLKNQVKQLKLETC